MVGDPPDDDARQIRHVVAVGRRRDRASVAELRRRCDRCLRSRLGAAHNRLASVACILITTSAPFCFLFLHLQKAFLFFCESVKRIHHQTVHTFSHLFFF